MIVAPTETPRRTLVEQARVILEPLPRDKRWMRRVQVLVPTAPEIFVAADVGIQAGFYWAVPRPPEQGRIATEQLAAMGKIGVIKDPRGGIGPDRNYTMPHMPTGQAIKFDLMPQQWLIGMALEGIAFVSLIVEYLREEA